MASILAERYGYRLYDSLILASALLAGCDTLYSDDLPPGQLIEQRLRVVDPSA